MLDWMELLESDTAQTICAYDHPAWGGIPAVTLNRYGTGLAAYLGCYFEPDGLEALLRYLLPQMDIAVPEFSFPLIRRSGVNHQGQKIDYFFNYSGDSQQVSCSHSMAISLLDGQRIEENATLDIAPWKIEVLEYIAQ